MLLLIGKILLLQIFFLSGISKIKNFKESVSGFKNVFFSKKLPNFIYNLILFLVIVLEILGPIIILYNSQTNNLTELSYYSSISLAIFTLLATYFYHNPITQKGQFYYFMKNVAIIGGLLVLSSVV
jgi:putative oxidoreductase|tara:strand:+ start:1418 stop:1795 length:378 start_codon:yes stop_codon:yes gene_type:complete